MVLSCGSWISAKWFQTHYLGIVDASRVGIYSLSPYCAHEAGRMEGGSRQSEYVTALAHHQRDALPAWRLRVAADFFANLIALQPNDLPKTRLPSDHACERRDGRYGHHVPNRLSFRLHRLCCSCPSTALGVFRWETLLLVAFCYVLGFALLLVCVLCFVTAWHPPKGCSTVQVGTAKVPGESVARGRLRGSSAIALAEVRNRKNHFVPRHRSRPVDTRPHSREPRPLHYVASDLALRST